MDFGLVHRGHMPTAKSSLVLVLKAMVLVATTLALFSQDLALVFTDAWQSETTSYLLVVPILLVYLIHRKRKIVKAVLMTESPKILQRLPLNEVVGALLALTSFLIYWYGSYTFTPLEYHVLALPIFVAACVLMLFNTQTLRQLLFPVFFLFLLVPPPAEILYNLGALLSSLSSELAYYLLAFSRIPVALSAESGTPTLYVTQSDGNVIKLAVDVACSGIYSLIGFLVFALFTAYVIRDRLWKKALVICLGIPLIYFLNVFRIAIIGVIAYFYGEALALNLFHLLGGWMLIFIGTFILLFISERLFKIHVLPKPTAACRDCGTPAETSRNVCFSCGKMLNIRVPDLSKRDLAKIASLILSVFLVLSVQTPVFALTQGPPEVILQTAQGGNETMHILPEFSDYSLRFMYRDTDFERLAKQDRSLIYAYTPYDGSKETIWVALEIASTRTSLHRWETCLISYPLGRGRQPRVVQLDLKDTRLLENPPIIGRFFAFNYTATNETQAVIYWYETSVFKINETSQQKQVKISLIAYPDGAQNLQDIESQLLSLATRLVGYWQPIKAWSQIALLLSQNGDKLIVINIIALGSVYAYYLDEKRKEKRQNTITYGKLSTANKQVIDAVHLAETRTQPILRAISTAYENTIGKTIEDGRLLQELYDVEKTGVLRSRTTSRDDEPVQTWETDMQFQEVWLERLRSRLRLTNPHAKK